MEISKSSTQNNSQFLEEGNTRYQVYETNGYDLIHLQGTLLLKKKKLIGYKLQQMKY